MCDNAPGGIEALANDWRSRRDDPLVVAAVAFLREKFDAVTSFGPQQVAVFYEAQSLDEKERRARRAYELVARFIELVG